MAWNQFQIARDQPAGLHVNDIPAVSLHRPASCRGSLCSAPIPVQRVAHFLANDRVPVGILRVDEHVRTDRLARDAPYRVVVRAELDFQAINALAQRRRGQMVPRRVHAGDLLAVDIEVRVALVRNRLGPRVLRSEQEIPGFEEDVEAIHPVWKDSDAHLRHGTPVRHLDQGMLRVVDGRKLRILGPRREPSQQGEGRKGHAA